MTRTSVRTSIVVGDEEVRLLQDSEVDLLDLSSGLEEHARHLKELAEGKRAPVEESEGVRRRTSSDRSSHIWKRLKREAADNKNLRVLLSFARSKPEGTKFLAEDVVDHAQVNGMPEVSAKGIGMTLGRHSLIREYGLFKRNDGRPIRWELAEEPPEDL